MPRQSEQPQNVRSASPKPRQIDRHPSQTSGDRPPRFGYKEYYVVALKRSGAVAAESPTIKAKSSIKAATQWAKPFFQDRRDRAFYKVHVYDVSRQNDAETTLVFTARYDFFLRSFLYAELNEEQSNSFKGYARTA